MLSEGVETALLVDLKTADGYDLSVKKAILAGTLQPIMWPFILMSRLLLLSWIVICRISAHIF